MDAVAAEAKQKAPALGTSPAAGTTKTAAAGTAKAPTARAAYATAALGTSAQAAAAGTSQAAATRATKAAAARTAYATAARTAYATAAKAAQTATAGTAKAAAASRTALGPRQASHATGQAVETAWWTPTARTSRKTAYGSRRTAAIWSAGAAWRTSAASPSAILSFMAVWLTVAIPVLL